MSALRAAPAALGVLLLATGCTNMPGAPEQLTGTLAGDLRFIGTSTALQIYLAAHPALPVADTVHLYASGSSSTAASTSYDLGSPNSNSALSGSVWKVAGYSAAAPVASGGTQFLVEARHVYFQGGGYYRFGFRNAGTAASHLSPAVNPAAALAFNVEECAAMVTVNVKLAGVTPADIAPLESAPSLGYACSVSADVDDASNGAFNPQARSAGASFTLSTLTSDSGGAISFPVRGHGQSTRFSASCSTTPPAGSGYASDNFGRTVFASTGDITSVACGSGTPGAPLVIEIPVRREAGDVAGRFDIVGYPESYAQVTLSIPGTGVYRNATPIPLPSNQPSPASWSMTSVQAGDALVTAGASITGGDLALQLPATLPPNPPGTISAGGALDLGSTFIAKPNASSGKLFLVDPARTTWLSTLANTAAVTWTGGSNTSFMQAEGDPALVDAAPGSATGGLSTGRLNGSYIPTQGCYFIFTQGCWELGYRLLFSGLSPINGALDGSDTRRTAWNVNRATLQFKDPAVDHSQSLWLRFGRDMRFYSKEPNVAPAQLPPLGVCLGQVELDFVADNATGRLFNPTFSHGSATVTAANTAIAPSDVFSSSGWASGRPATQANAALSARVVASVPEGASYLLSPAVRIVPATTTVSTQISALPQVRLPASGTLACSQVERACIKINSPAGSTAQALQVSIGGQSYCSTGGTVSLQVSVDSGSVPVDSVDYKVDGGASVNYCTGCGSMSSSAPITLAPAGQPFAAGAHSIEVTVRSQNGCTAVTSYSFNACTIIQSTKQLAYFDVNRLNLIRLEDNQPVFAPVHLTGGAGPISFNAAGSKLAVRQQGQVRTLSAADGSELAVEPGSFADFAFRPGAASGDDRAFIESIGAGFPLALRSVLGGAPQPAAAIPGTQPTPGVTLSAFRLAWSHDGTRVALAYNRTAGVNDHRLVYVEWPISANTLGAASVGDWQIPAGEQLRAFAYDTQIAETRFLFATTQTVYRATTNGILQPLFAFPVARADLHRPFIAALAPSQTNTQAFLFTDVAAAAEPAIGQIWGLAVSDFASLADPILAVARSTVVVAPGQPNFIALYRLLVQGGGATLVQDRIYSAQEPAFPTFRPAGP